MLQEVPSKSHFWMPAVAWLAADATFPFTGGLTSVPSPSSHTYRVFASANQMPKGKATGLPVLQSSATPLASVVGNPGRTVIGAAARSAWLPVGSAPASPTWYTVLIPFPPLPLVTYSVLLKIVRPRKLLSFPALSGVGYPSCVISKSPIMSMLGGTGGVWPGTRNSAPVDVIRLRPTCVVVS